MWPTAAVRTNSVFEITIPESMRDELDLATGKYFRAVVVGWTRLRATEAITTAVMKGLQTIVTTLETHKGTGRRRGWRCSGGGLQRLGLSFDLTGYECSTPNSRSSRP
jgi:hypothetical protein